MKYKYPVENFLNELEDTVIMAKEDELGDIVSKKYKKGVKDTIAFAKLWFEDMQIKELKIEPKED